MSEERKAKGIVAAAMIWIVIIALLAVSYKFVVKPLLSGREAAETGSASQYDHTVRVDLDSFSGYCVLRSPVLRNELKSKRIRLDLHDDGADYKGRLKALRSGNAQMAVFTIDSYLAAGADLGEFPASIVLVIDETQGADGIVAYKEGVASIQDLDDPEARFVLTPDSPSEFLARVVLAQFSLPSLPDKWAVNEDGAEKVYRAFRSADHDEKRAYVLWEPYITRALEEDGAHVLLDSGKLKGYIVDVLVVERRFLREHPEVVGAVVEGYLRTAYSYRSRGDAMGDLVVADAREAGDKLTEAQAAKLVDGIHWKNTVENYGHFGLVRPSEAGSVRHLEDMIPAIADVLVKTGRLNADPVAGGANTLYYDQILRDLQARDFHPAKKGDALPGLALEFGPLDAAKQDEQLPALSDEQWGKLTPVGQMSVKPIAFGRGGARLNVQSKRELAALAERLNSMPGYYVLVVGHARAEGDASANQQLASDRASAAADALRQGGVHANRIHATTDVAAAGQGNGDAQSVSFVVGRPPY